MKNVLLIISLFLAVGASADQKFEDLEFLVLENFSVVKIDGKVRFGYDYIIKNRNWYSIIIKPSFLFRKIDDTDCGWVKVEEKIKVKGNTTRGYHFVLVGDDSQFVKSTFSSIWNMMSGKGIGFNIAGQLKAGVFLIKL